MAKAPKSAPPAAAAKANVEKKEKKTKVSYLLLRSSFHLGARLTFSGVQEVQEGRQGAHTRVKLIRGVFRRGGF